MIFNEDSIFRSSEFRDFDVAAQTRVFLGVCPALSRPLTTLIDCHWFGYLSSMANRGSSLLATMMLSGSSVLMPRPLPLTNTLPRMLLNAWAYFSFIFSVVRNRKLYGSAVQRR